MPANYRVIVHYNLKKGKEGEGLKFLERELIQQGQKLGAHYIEVWQNEKDPTHVEGIAVWNDLQEAKGFQSHWENKEKEFTRLYCTDTPKKELYQLRHIYTEKMKKVA